MSNNQKIWNEAIFANCCGMENHKSGMYEFEELYGKYGSDGMIDYERGETNEFWGNKSAAIEDYKNAENNFPMEH